MGIFIPKLGIYVLTKEQIHAIIFVLKDKTDTEVGSLMTGQNKEYYIDI